MENNINTLLTDKEAETILNNIIGEEEPQDIECNYKQNITCPYCGYENIDSWEMDDDGETECGECDKPFRYNRYVEVLYNSSKINGA